MSTTDPIAIIALNCQFPGATNLENFWELIVRAGKSFGSLEDRPFVNRLLESCSDLGFDPTGILSAGVIKRPYHFDPKKFRMSGKEARSMDPQGRLLLEVTWGLLEDAGLMQEDLSRSRTGMYIGISSSDYQQDIVRNTGNSSEIDINYAMGTSSSASVGRVSHFFNWNGPALAIDTACSSSLVALISACDSLTMGRVDLAVAGGVNLILSELTSIAFMGAKMLSPDGQCRPFDSRANGYVRGEGCGLVLLKRLSEAQRDGDIVHAIIRGAAMNHNGTSNGLTAPSPVAQKELMMNCWKQASDIKQNPLDYIEAHGTGTHLGDPIEARAIAASLNELGIPPTPIGSVKANIGHLEAAAGIASVIKSVLIGRYGYLTPQSNYETANPLMKRYEKALHVGQAKHKLSGHHARIGINSLGFSGTNAHLLLDVPCTHPQLALPPLNRPVIIGLSAQSNAGLLQRLTHISKRISEPNSPGLTECIQQLQYAPHQPKRCAIFVKDKSGLSKGIERLISAFQSIDDSKAQDNFVDNIMLVFDTRLGFLDHRLEGFERYSDYLAFERSYILATSTGRYFEFPKIWYFLIFMLAKQYPQISFGNIRALAWRQKDPFTLTEELYQASLLNPSTDINETLYMLKVGSSLQLHGPGLPNPKLDNAEHETMSALGQLYSLGFIYSLPKLALARPIRRDFHRTDSEQTLYYHSLAQRKTKPLPDRKRGSELFSPKLERYLQKWVAANPITSGKDNQKVLVLTDLAGSEITLPASLTAASYHQLILHETGLVAAGTLYILPLPYTALDQIHGALRNVVTIWQRLHAAHGEHRFNLHLVVQDTSLEGAALAGAVTGLMATLNLENPEHSGAVVRVNSMHNPLDWVCLSTLIESTEGATELGYAIREGQLFIQRLVSAPLPVADKTTVDPVAGQVLVITGAGSEIAQGLLRLLLLRQPKQVVLISRRNESESMQSGLRELALSHGVDWLYVQCDISLPEQVDSCLSSVFTIEQPVLLFHAAGTLGERCQIEHLSEPIIRSAWAAKVDGLLNILKLLGPNTGQLCLYGSISAIWGISGHAAYAAANGFLQGVATHSISGQKTICHAWGVWDQSVMLQEGMRSDRQSQFLAEIGLYAHDTRAGHDATIASLYSPGGADLLVAMHPERVAMHQIRAKGLFAHLNATASAASSDDRVRKAFSNVEVRQYIEKYLHDNEELVLDLPGDLYRGYFDLGLNSLVLVALGNALSQEFGVELSANDILQASNIELLSQHIVRLGNLGE